MITKLTDRKKEFKMQKGRFGIHGGQYVPELLMSALEELEEAYDHYKNDPDFNKELQELLNEYAPSLFRKTNDRGSRRRKDLS